MTELRKFTRTCIYFAAIFLALLTSCAWARDGDSYHPSSASPSSQQGTAEAPPSETKAPPQNADNKISSKEAADLFREVDHILQFASQDTAFPIKRQVKPRLTGRDQVVGYLQKNMAEDKDARRLR